MSYTGREAYSDLEIIAEIEQGICMAFPAVAELTKRYDSIIPDLAILELFEQEYGIDRNEFRALIEDKNREIETLKTAIEGLEETIHELELKECA